MLKTPRPRKGSPRAASSRKRTLHLSRETVRKLTTDDLALAAGGSCPTGSWPTTQNERSAQGC